MIPDQTKQTKALLLVLAEATVPCWCATHIDHSYEYGGEAHAKCNGTGTVLDPRCEIFRVTCDEPWIHDPDWYYAFYEEEHYKTCTGTRPLTVAEAEANGLAMIAKFGIDLIEDVERKDWEAMTGEPWAAGGKGDTPLLAILAAVAVMVGVKLPEVTQNA